MGRTPKLRQSCATPTFKESRQTPHWLRFDYCPLRFGLRIRSINRTSISSAWVRSIVGSSFAFYPNAKILWFRLIPIPPLTYWTIAMGPSFSIFHWNLKALVSPSHCNWFGFYYMVFLIQLPAVLCLELGCLFLWQSPNLKESEGVTPVLLDY